MPYNLKLIRIPEKLKEKLLGMKQNEKEPLWRVIDRTIAEINYSKDKKNKVKIINLHLNEIKKILGASE
jgi:hypothetical protein